MARSRNKNYSFNDNDENTSDTYLQSERSTRNRHRPYDTDDFTSNRNKRKVNYSDDTYDEDIDDFDDFDDDGYEDYGELGSNFSPSDDPNWGYDDPDAYDRYKKFEGKIYSPNSPVTPPKKLDFSNLKANIGPDAYIDEDYFDDNGRFTGERKKRSSPSENYPQNKPSTSYPRDDKDLRDYLNAIKRYDRGELNNYEMSKVQRKYAHNPFWKTFNPSKDLIKKYGNGNESTKWPMFELKDGQWTPNIWRND